MHDRGRGLGRDWLDVLRRKRLGWLCPEYLRPCLGPQAPRCRMRMILDRPRPVPPDVHDFDHSAFAGSWTASTRRAENMALFTVQGRGPLPFPGWEDAICF